MLPPQLFPSISWFIYAAKADEINVGTDVRFEKQSPHSRYAIAAPNKSQWLTIPVIHTGAPKNLLDTEISFREKWQKEHIHALKSAYGKSPFFEFYDYRFFPLIDSDDNLLFTRIQASIIWLCSCLLPEKKLNFIHATPKDLLPIKIPPFDQVFEEKFGFRSEVSALDLLFNLGPGAYDYLMEYDRNCGL